MKLATLDRIVSSLLAAAAVLILILLVRREFGYGPPAGITLPGAEPELIEEWDATVTQEALYRIGSADAPVQITVFFDLECPFCARFHENVIAPFLAERPGDVAVSFVHLPLTAIHRFAEPAAKALECAAEHGVYLNYKGAVYAKRDSLGLKTWASFASDAGVGQLSTFQGCVDTPGVPDRVRLGRQVAEALGVSGTPTIVVNGWNLGPPPSRELLAEVISRVRRGEAPVEVPPES